MLILILGQKGSGKTLRIIRECVIKGKNRIIYTNFNVKKSLKDYVKIERLKYGDIVRKKVKDVFVKTGKPKSYAYSVNWDFWKEARKAGKFSIMLDEFHNVMNSRRAMQADNIVISDWLSQIRKILNDDPTNHLYIISQKLRRVDINSRELADLIIECRKIVRKGKTIIVGEYYRGLEQYEQGIKVKTDFFVGDPFFKHYTTDELIDFGDVEAGYI